MRAGPCRSLGLLATYIPSRLTYRPTYIPGYIREQSVYAKPYALLAFGRLGERRRMSLHFL